MLREGKGTVQHEMRGEMDPRQGMEVKGEHVMHGSGA